MSGSLCTTCGKLCDARSLPGMSIYCNERCRDVHWRKMGWIR